MFLDRLEQANQRMNLTRIPADKALSLHLLDSLSACRTLSLPAQSRLLDIGSGAGLPGIPLAVAYPRISVTLLDSVGKRANFLLEIIAALALGNATVLQARAEQAAHQLDYRESFDFATVRAVAKLDILSELGLPFLKSGGKLIAYKAENIESELRAAQKALQFLGGEIADVVPVTLPFTSVSRKLVIIEKVRGCPSIYPRSNKLIRSRPLGRGAPQSTDAR